MSTKNDPILQKVIADKLAGSVQHTADGSAPVNTAMLDWLDRMNKTAVNRSYRDIPAYSFKGKLVRLVKRLMRRLTFWYVEPCMMQQTDYNSANNRFSAEVNSELNTMRMQLADAQSAKQALQGDLSRLTQELAQLRELVKAMDDGTASRFAGFAHEQQAFENMANARLFQHDEQLRKLEKLTFLHGADGELLPEEADDVRASFSQSGEDAIIRYIFGTLGIDPGACRYLALGANHAVHLSNTYGFYREGASGVLVDANPVLTQELSERRPRDIVLNRCLSDQPGVKLPFYVMNGDGLSTMDHEAALSFIRDNPALKIERTVEVDSITIDEIIREHFADKAPEIMNIDVEGMELTILKMIDFAKFRPLLIICEMIEYKNGLTVGEKNAEILAFMEQAGYREFAFTGINSIFIDAGKEVTA